MRRPLLAAVLSSLGALGCGPGRAIPDATDTATAAGPTTDGGTGTAGIPTTGEAMSGTTSMVSGGSASSATEASTTTDASSSTSADTTTPGAACDPRTQDCAPGEKCVAYDSPEGLDTYWDANHCVPEPVNPAQEGEPCAIDEGEAVFSGLDNCAAGTICFFFDIMTGKGGTCTAYCNERNTCGADALCIENANLGILPLCFSTCDPVAQDCEDMQGCYGDPALADFICAPPQIEPGMGMDGSPCQFVTACLPGLTCQEGTLLKGCVAEYCCTPFCSIAGGDAACAASEDCVPFYANNPPDGLEDVGVCSLPG